MGYRTHRRMVGGVYVTERYDDSECGDERMYGELDMCTDEGSMFNWCFFTTLVLIPLILIFTTQAKNENLVSTPGLVHSYHYAEWTCGAMWAETDCVSI